MTFALERPVQFLYEEWTEPYMQYGEGIPQQKTVRGAKNAWQEQTCFGLERRGA